MHTTRLYLPGGGRARFDGNVLTIIGRGIAEVRTWNPVTARWLVPWQKGWQEVRPVLSLGRTYACGGLLPPHPPAKNPTDLRQLELPFGQTKKRPASDIAYARGFLMIPMHVRQLVRRFTERQWEVLRLIDATGERGYELAQSNPALAFLIASHHVFTDSPRPSGAVATDLLSMPRRKAAAALGFPDSSTRILSKIASNSLCIIRLLLLRSALRDKAVLRWLRHLPRINSSIIRIVSDPDLRSMLSPKFLAELAHLEEARQEEHMLRTIGQLKKVGLPSTRRAVFRSLTHLHDLHSKVAHIGTSEEHMDLLQRRFPPPPIAGTAEIVPLTSPAALLDEAHAMHHCAGSLAYILSVLNGSTFFYRVKLPQERATLALTRDPDGSWGIDEIKGVENMPVCSKTLDAVSRWLTSMQPPFKSAGRDSE